jgi:hypothetical protein
VSPDGRPYKAQVCGAQMAPNMWEAWIEFLPADEKGPALRSGRETTQPNKTDTAYWATGLTQVYLEGALKRALHPLTITSPPPLPEPVFDAPAPIHSTGQPGPHTPLNPFSVFDKGEMLLRKELSAMAAWRLLDMIRAYGFSEKTETQLSVLPPAALIDLIVEGVKRRTEKMPAS